MGLFDAYVVRPIGEQAQNRSYPNRLLSKTEKVLPAVKEL